jgi:hypothetical protein
MVCNSPASILTALRPLEFAALRLADLHPNDTGAAWLSSARVVNRWVKSRHERNPP